MKTVFLTFALPLELLYRLLVRVDRWRKKTVRIQNAKVISIGNLSMGGTGKTPFTLYLAQFIQRKTSGINLTILSRGYKAKLSGQGAKLPKDPDPKEYGDEPCLLQSKLPEAEIIIGQNRWEAYTRFHKSSGKDKKDLVLLDDGFQHYRIWRDLDLVLIDSTRGIGNGHTLPFGPLREPISALKRADAVILTKWSASMDKGLDSLYREIERVNPLLPLFRFSFQISRFSDPHGKTISEAHFTNQSALLFCGIANPSQFFQMALQLNFAQVYYTEYSDHHEFTEKDLWSMKEKFPEASSWICTEKDMTKLQKLPNIANFPVYALELDTKLLEEDKFSQLLREKGCL